MEDDCEEQGKRFIRDGVEDLCCIVHGARSPVRFRDAGPEKDEGNSYGRWPSLSAVDAAMLPFTHG
jgi:hypothetical protein